MADQSETPADSSALKRTSANKSRAKKKAVEVVDLTADDLRRSGVPASKLLCNGESLPKPVDDGPQPTNPKELTSWILHRSLMSSANDVGRLYHSHTHVRIILSNLLQSCTKNYYTAHSSRRFEGVLREWPADDIQVQAEATADGYGHCIHHDWRGESQAVQALFYEEPSRTIHSLRERQRAIQQRLLQLSHARHRCGLLLLRQYWFV